MPYICPEILDIIFGFVPSIGLHVSKKYDALSHVVDPYMTGKHFLIMEHNPKYNRCETIERLITKKIVRKKYPESVYPYLAALEVFSIDQIKRQMDYREKYQKILLSLVSTRQLKELFDDAFIRELLVIANMTRVNINTIMAIDLEDNLKKVYVDLMESVYIYGVPINIYPVCLPEQMDGYNHLLGHILFKSSSLPDSLRVTIARALVVHGTTESPEKILNAIIRR